MTVTDVQHAELRAQLGLADDVLAVNAGSWGPLSSAAQVAIQRSYERDRQLRTADHLTHMAEFFTDVVDRDRAAVARLLDCDPNEVALCESTGAAMNILLWAVDLQPGDEIVTGSLENPALTVPLRLVAQRRDVTVRQLDLGYGERDAAALLADVVSARTRLVIISDVNFATGARIDASALVAAAHAHGALVALDGIQAIGACPVSVRATGVDAYAIARHKFLCGPDGGGALYVAADVVERLQASFVGVFAVADHGHGTGLDFYRDARKFEVSTRSVPVVAGATAAVEWLDREIGMSEIHSRTRDSVAALRRALADVGRVRVISPVNQDGGLLTFAIEGMDPVDIVTSLKIHKVYTRTITVIEPQAVRISLGFWNRESDTDRIAEIVARMADG